MNILKRVHESYHNRYRNDVSFDFTVFHTVLRGSFRLLRTELYLLVAVEKGISMSGTRARLPTAISKYGRPERRACIDCCRLALDQHPFALVSAHLCQYARVVTTICKGLRMAMICHDVFSCPPRDYRPPLF